MKDDKNQELTNLLLIELSLQISAIKSILVKTGLASEKEILEEVKSVESKMLDVAENINNSNFSSLNVKVKN